MLLRVDIYPHNAKIEEVDEKGIPVSPLDPLYVCLGTSKENGELFSVARKDSDVVFSDKSVSRAHLKVSLKAAHESIEDRETCQPVTEEEIKACEDDPDGMCLVLTDSSRFGTYLVKEGSAPRKAAPAKDKDETGSDTEDESQNPNKDNGVTLSPVAAKLTKNNATLEKMKPDSPLVIPELKDRLLVQCGQNGSTLLIRRMPFNILWSRLDKSTKALWHKRLPALGGTALEHAQECLTHLVTDQRTPNAKHLAAWYMNVPNVTSEYLQSIWDRRSPKDPWPKESECQPTVGSKDTFWKKKPNTKLLSGCTFLALLDDDMPPMCRAAGAAIVELHAETEKDAIKRLKEMDLEHAFYIQSKNRKVAKIAKHLAKSTTVPHVTQKALAQALTKMIPLEDSKGNRIGPEVEEEEEEAPLPPPEDHEQEDAPVVIPPSEGGKEEKQEDTLQSKLPPIETIPEASRETSEASMEQENAEEEADEAATKETSKRKKRSGDASQQEPEEPPKQRRKTSKETQEEEETSVKRKKGSDEETSQESESRSRKKRSKESSQNELVEEEPPNQRRKMSKDAEEVEEEEKSREEEEEADWNMDDAEPKKLEKSTDGWFVAAPPGKQRKAYLRPVEYDGVEKPPSTAGTKKCSNLVVAPTRSKTAKRAQSMGRRGGTKDFKRFRKNSVKKGATSRIQLRSVLPKESEAEQALDERERALEEEQRLADALFRDPGSGIRGHFKPKKRKKRS